MSSAEPSGQTAQVQALLDAFLKAWGDMTVFPPIEPDDARTVRAPRNEPVPQRAYLVFNRWEDNPLAQTLVEDFPKWARDRVTVPDSYFAHREDRAPVLLELPEALILAETGKERMTVSVRQWLAQCLDHATQQRQQRLLAQDFCGVVISAANEQAITRHWVGLGDQRPPYSDGGVLFRYQDPRVMQRVWPSLSPYQQTRWLGPVTQWWSLLQPWGPFHAQAEPAQWFRAKAPVPPPDAPSGSSPRDLFTQDQWFLAGVSPAANAIWRGYANNDVPAEAQPDAHSMVQMLADAARLGLTGLNLEDYVWSTWLHRPKEGPPRAMDWSLPHTAPVLTQVLKQLQAQPDARFSTLFAQAIRAGS